MAGRIFRIVIAVAQDTRHEGVHALRRRARSAPLRGRGLSIGQRSQRADFDLLDQANALKREHQASGGQECRPDEDGQHEPPHWSTHSPSPPATVGRPPGRAEREQYDSPTAPAAACSGPGPALGKAEVPRPQAEDRAPRHTRRARSSSASVWTMACPTAKAAASRPAAASHGP